VIGDMSDEDARRYAGQWVATKDGKALFGSPDLGEVFDWLDEHEVDDATIIRLRAKNEPKHWMFESLRAAD
jgi:hypothetical protein